jgi:hypothetical protein
MPLPSPHSVSLAVYKSAPPAGIGSGARYSAGEDVPLPTIHVHSTYVRRSPQSTALWCWPCVGFPGYGRVSFQDCAEEHSIPLRHAARVVWRCRSLKRKSVAYSDVSLCGDAEGSCEEPSYTTGLAVSGVAADVVMGRRGRPARVPRRRLPHRMRSVRVLGAHQRGRARHCRGRVR